MRFIRALHDLRAEGHSRAGGAVFGCEDDIAKHLMRRRHAVAVEAPGWEDWPGADLQTVAIAPGAWSRVVACLNIWNDLAALRATMDSWYPHVDAVLAVDGAYASTGAPTGPSTDGTVEFLQSLAKVTLITQAAIWPDQRTKRSAYFAAARPGDLLFVVDADEEVEHAAALRTAPALDVGWVTMANPLYAHPYRQPRLFRSLPGLHYRGRHHWVYRDGTLVATHQYGGLALQAAVPITIYNRRGLGHSEERRAVKRRHLLRQYGVEQRATADATSAASDQHGGARESLRILQTTVYDAGLAPSRLHSALNATTPHASLFVRAEDGGPFGAPAQFLQGRDGWVVDALLPDADVLHAHLTLAPYAARRRALPPMVVQHHHGSMYRAQPAYHHAHARALGALPLVSTLELLQYGPAEWLPNPMPVMRYRQLRAATPRPPGPFRIAHSPSKREIKGTEAFLAACARLTARGVAVEPVLIEGMGHAAGMARKAACDAVFDSFWLGIQCSGLEGAAMGLPVIAGDALVAAAYRERLGAVPYTFAETGDALDAVITRLATDEAYRASEALRVMQYVETVHDEAAVVRQYLDMLDFRFGWRSGRHVHRPRPTTVHRPPSTRHPATAPVVTPRREPTEIRE